MSFIAIDLNPGASGETLDPAMWNDVDCAAAVQAMADTVPEEEKRDRLRPHMSLRALADIADPTHISESLRERLAEVAPDYLAQHEKNGNDKTN